MPSPNVATKTPTKKTPEKALDLGQKLARRKSQDFKSKVDDWARAAPSVPQEHSEIVVIEDDEEKDDGDDGAVEVVVIPEAGEGGEEKEIDTPGTPKTPAGAKTPKPTSQRKTSREVDFGKQAWVRRKSKPSTPDVKIKPEAPEATGDVKKAGVPKKRVVSDGHWRRDRTPKKETPTPEKEKEKEKETTPKPIIIRKSVVGVGLKFPPSTQDFEEEPEPVKRRPIPRRTRSKSETRDRDERDATPDYESSGTKVYIKRRRRSKTMDCKALSASESNLTVSSSFDRPSSATDITIPDISPLKDEPPRPRTAPKERLSSGLLKDDLRRKAPADKTPVVEPLQRASRKRDGDLRGSAPMADTDANPPPPKVFGSRIEGWLATMKDDPFTENSEASLTPEPLDLSRKKGRRSDVYSKDENDDYAEVRRSSTGRRRHRPSLEPIDTNERSRPASAMRTPVNDGPDVSPAGTPTLKRSGARRTTHSPVMDKTMRGASTYTEKQSSVPTRENSRRHNYTGLHGKTLPGAGRLARIPSIDSLHSRALPSRPRDHSNDSRNTMIPERSVLSRASDGDEPRAGGGLKRRLTKHSDLMSVLSMSKNDDPKIKSARSIRTRRYRDESATIGEIMNEISTDELKYQRELRTLVDGVIPVLLTHVLSKDDSKRTPGSRSSSVKDNPALTQPICAMGVALERLKASHKRIPMHDPNEFLLWAQSSIKVYDDYLQVWRLGFEDIVVNLAPAEEGEKLGPQDTQQGDGERVDVAYLLKRPLVRMKTMSKTLKGICQIKPSALGEDVTATYSEMVSEARKRHSDEKARLEDEAAAAIDPTRARDPRNLAQLSGVNIDPSRTVQARDFCDLEFYHSSGQQIDCKIELIRRENVTSTPGPGDVLFCEIATTGRWLLFPPILASSVSARKGDKEGELFVMVRGELASGTEWREIMILRSSDEQANEWVQIFGSNPMPPRLNRQSSFNTLRKKSGPMDTPPSPTESIVPIGERAKATAQKWDGTDVNSIVGDLPPRRFERSKPSRYRSMGTSPLARDEYQASASRRGYDSGHDHPRGPRHARSHTESYSDDGRSSPKKEYSVWLPSSRHGSDESSGDEEDKPQRRPTMHRRMSSVPSSAMPSIPKQRKSSQHIEDEFETPKATKSRQEDPSSAPSKLTKERPASSDESKKQPAKKTPLFSTPGSRPISIPSFTPEFLKKHRRSSSPLKHEYAPSTASESSSESDFSDEDDAESVTSESTVEDEAVSVVGSLQDFNKFGTHRPTSRSASKSMHSIAEDTLGPSDSPSQAPYRSVPPSANGSAKSVACIFSWADSGTWDSLHPEECEIVVTPGLIEAFDIAQANAVSKNGGGADEPSPSRRGVRPLVALELTPLVPLRRGTAVDISIRSPPTQNSLLRKGSNMMFRSRSPEDCEKLYALINRARIDNPTWIALQNARGPAKSNWAEVMDKRNASRSDNQSWIKSLSRKGSTYRSKGPRSASIAASQSSVGTMDSAISALRRFSGGKIFDIAKSTIKSKQSTRSSYSDSLSSGAATPIPIDPSMGTPVGITNAKVRLYARETDSKWRDMGSARLTIMLPPRPQHLDPQDPAAMGLLKRVMVNGKSNGAPLLDVTLPENAFERIQRTGIAVTYWEDLLGPNGELGHAAATGGVTSRRTRTYLIQMKSEREAAYTFSMVGKLRY